MDKITHEESNHYFADWIEGKITEKEYSDLVSSSTFLLSKKLDVTFKTIKELDKPMDKMLAEIKKVTKQKESKLIPLFIKWSSGIAAAIILLFSLNTFLNVKDHTIQTNFGEQKTIALLDDSQVIMNAKSTITYNSKSWKKNRELFLEGEAYFKVTKKGNTFTVNTKNGSVTVLGTHFNVKSDNNYFKVTCYEGKVKVIDNSKKETILTPGKSIISYKNKTEDKNIVINEPTWISGKITFKDVPLEVVLNELEKQFDITIDRDSVDISQKYTGAFSNKNLRVSLSSVLKPMQLSFTKKGSKIILKSENE